MQPIQTLSIVKANHIGLSFLPLDSHFDTWSDYWIIERNKQKSIHVLEI